MISASSPSATVKIARAVLMTTGRFASEAPTRVMSSMAMSAVTAGEVCSTPMPNPCISVRVRPSSGAPLPMFFRVKSANGSSTNRHPDQSSTKRTENRSASSTVESGFRLSSRSTNIGAPELLPRIQKPTPRASLQSCVRHDEPSSVNVSITTAHDAVFMLSASTSLSDPAPGRPASTDRSNVGTFPAPCAENHPNGGTAAGSPNTNSASKSSTTSVRRDSSPAATSSSSRMRISAREAPSVAPEASLSTTANERLPRATSSPVVGTVICASCSPAASVSVSVTAV